MNTKLELNKEYRNTKLQILAFSSVLSILSIFGCGENNKMDDAEYSENARQLEENLNVSNDFFPSDAKKKAKKNVTELLKNITGEELKNNPHSLSRVLEEEDPRMLGLLLTYGDELKQGLTGISKIGGYTVIDSVVISALGKNIDRTNPFINKSRRAEAKPLFEIVLKTIPPNEPVLYESLEKCIRGNWATGAIGCLNKIFEEKNFLWEKTLNIPLLLFEEQEKLFFGTWHKEEVWEKVLEVIITKNHDIDYKKSVTHQGLAKAVECKWPKFANNLASKLYHNNNPIPAAEVMRYKKLFDEELIKKKKMNEYASVRNFIIDKLGNNLCTAARLASLLEYGEDGSIAIMQILAKENLKLESDVLENKIEYGKYKNIIVFAAKKYSNITSFESILNQIDHNLNLNKKEEYFKDLLNRSITIAKKEKFNSLYINTMERKLTT